MATKVIQNERSIEYQETIFFLSFIALIFNQAAGFLDHQYLLKEAIFVLDFFNQDLYQRKTVLKNNTSGWVWSGPPNHIETFIHFQIYVETGWSGDCRATIKNSSE